MLRLAREARKGAVIRPVPADCHADARRTRFACFHKLCGLFCWLVLVANFGDKPRAQIQELPDAPVWQGGPAAGKGADVPGFEVIDFKAIARGEESPAGSLRPLWRQKPVVSPGAHQGGESNRYHWRGLIVDTVGFNLLENGFRLAVDPVMRDTIAHRPFWHDYIASVNQFNMRRWNDGDTFIVNYVGHSMHGAVTADMEIQNSPTDARLQWGDEGYARSRFKGFLWAVMFSTQSELGPAGEPAVGNEGGFTYGVECQYHCNSSNFHPGDHYTNNTGWVDFIVSPTAGMVWVTTEDVLDKYVSSYFVKKHPDRLWPLIVRGSLNPSRSFVTMVRGHAPWYRDYEQPAWQPERVHLFPADETAAYQQMPRVQLAPFWSRFTIAANTPGCFNCRETAIGGGLQATVKLHDWLGFDSSVSYHPGASPLPSDRAGGNMLAAFFGLSATKQWHYYALHLAMRPGMVQFDRAYLNSPVLYPVLTFPPRIATHGGDADGMPVPGVVDANGTPEQPALGPIHHFVWDWNVGLDYRLTERVGFRVGLEDAVVRYRTDKVDAPGIGVPPYLSWLSKQQFINRGNFTMQVGPVFSF